MISEEFECGYSIRYDGEIFEMNEDFEDETGHKEIGNYFSSKEEADEAVKKLKALQRLHKKGFRILLWSRRSDWAGLVEVPALENLIDITAYLPKDKIEEMEADLDLLFGGGA